MHITFIPLCLSTSHLFLCVVFVYITFILLFFSTSHLFLSVCAHQIYYIVFVELIDVVVEYTGDGGISHSDDTTEEYIDRYFDKIIKVRKFPGMYVLHLCKFITGVLSSI